MEIKRLDLIPKRLIAYVNQNQKVWNQKALIHAKSDFYDVEGFKSGESSLYALEVEALGDVSEKSLLHLQCHFGLDTMSWARRGANVVGVDFSDEAITCATEIADELGIPARFVYANVYELESVLDELFDIVRTYAEE